ncbi:MAG: aspartate--tRNA ligase [Firmicutes bacterium]|nr:aspartate--tRNA ligase [Bacillota bacterium]
MFLTGFKRTALCADITEKSVGKEVTVMGWAAVRRDFGGLIFVDLRDRSGILQIVCDAGILGSQFSSAEKIRSEYVLAVKGRLRKRSDETINPKIPTGTIEVVATELRILSEAETPPFVIDNDVSSVNEVVRLKYRYLELRTEELQSKLLVRSKLTNAAHSYFNKQGFVEIETPFLGKSTPEGARDYLVPSRVHNGAFYALPQSPQLYKQLLMISGFDRYYQIARCFRDEDLRANRQPEFTQIDLEMSFVDGEEDIMKVVEGFVKDAFKKNNKKLPAKIKRYSYQEAMDRFGSDKPDTRFGLELTDVSDIVKDCGFGVFDNAIKGGGSVRMINAKGFVDEKNPILSRRDIDALTDFVKTYRAKGLAWIAFKEDGIQSVITKFMSEESVAGIIKAAKAKTGDILFFCADKTDIVYDSLGALRLHLAEIGGLIDKSKYDVLWVKDFPLLEYDPEAKRYVAKHHPFTSPKNEDLELLDTVPEKVRAKAYDLVINGQEVGGGSIRIHSKDVQQKMFNVLGFTDEQIEERFGFFVNAFKYGTPPHGGFAFGLDRLTMLLTGTDNIKDVIAFPKVQNASDLMTQAPAPVEMKQLRDLGINIKEKTN